MISELLQSLTSLDRISKSKIIKTGIKCVSAFIATVLAIYMANFIIQSVQFLVCPAKSLDEKDSSLFAAFVEPGYGKIVNRRVRSRYEAFLMHWIRRQAFQFSKLLQSLKILLASRLGINLSTDFVNANNTICKVAGTYNASWTGIRSDMLQLVTSLGYLCDNVVVSLWKLVFDTHAAFVGQFQQGATTLFLLVTAYYGRKQFRFVLESFGLSFLISHMGLDKYSSGHAERQLQQEDLSDIPELIRDDFPKPTEHSGSGLQQLKELDAESKSIEKVEGNAVVPLAKGLEMEEREEMDDDLSKDRLVFDSQLGVVSSSVQKRWRASTVNTDINRLSSGEKETRYSIRNSVINTPVPLFDDESVVGPKHPDEVKDEEKVDSDNEYVSFCSTMDKPLSYGSYDKNAHRSVSFKIKGKNVCTPSLEKMPQLLKQCGDKSEFLVTHFDKFVT
mmetsp:Transcript_12191/g.14164  ORF Transcript_12191/g.14164 Transcript_12191/m.14164 type:complete len:447 (+) Transcript_12191:217-1557(+)